MVRDRQVPHTQNKLHLSRSKIQKEFRFISVINHFAWCLSQYRNREKFRYQCVTNDFFRKFTKQFVASTSL